MATMTSSMVHKGPWSTLAIKHVPRRLIEAATDTTGQGQIVRHPLGFFVFNSFLHVLRREGMFWKRRQGIEQPTWAGAVASRGVCEWGSFRNSGTRPKLGRHYVSVSFLSNGCLRNRMGMVGYNGKGNGYQCQV